MITYVNIAVYSCLLLIGYFMGRMSGENIIYGVTIRDEMKNDPVIGEVEASYKNAYRVIGSVILVISLVLDQYWKSEFSIIIFSVLWIVTIVYLYLKANKILLNVKAGYAFDESAKVVRTASLTPREKETYKSKWLFLIPCVLTLAVVVLSFINMGDLPDQIPIHFDGRGVADRYADTSLLTVMGLPITMTIMTLFMYGISIYSVKYSKRRIDPKKPLTSEIQASIAANRMLMILALITTVAIGIEGYFQLVLLGLIDMNTTTATWVLIVPFGVIAVGFIAFLLTTGAYGEKVKVSIDEQGKTSEVLEDDDKYWKWGMFYYNKNDASFMVPKRMGLGYTFNFGNPLSWLALVAIFAFIAISILLSVE